MSTLKINTLQAVAGGATVPIADVINGSARAWVNFNGTGTVAIRASYNVAGITDVAVGTWEVNFATPMSSIDFVVHSTLSDGGVSNRAVNEAGAYGANRTTSKVRVNSFTVAGASVDSDGVFVTVYR